MKPVVVVSAYRTAVGSYGKSLTGVSSVELGRDVIKAALEKVDLDPEIVDEVVLGCVLQAGLGQNVARQAALNAGIPVEVPCTTINMICGSGMKSITMAADAISNGSADIMVAGGTENMSSGRYALEGARWGMRMGDQKAVDLMIKDGLWCAFEDYHMGVTAENVAERYEISRQEQDSFALESHEKAIKSINDGRFKEEIVPVEIPGKKGTTQVFETDEHPRSTNLEALEALKPVFKKEGTVTAGNASGLNDGAAVLVLMSEEKAKQLGVKPLAYLRSHASAGVDPAFMGTGPVPATRKALDRLGWSVKDLDLVEANEAFASQAIYVIREMGFDTNIVNVNGGAIALGHPIGTSGARITVSLIHEMVKQDAYRGLATLCVGGGQGVACALERPDDIK